MDINELITEAFDPKTHFANRFAKYSGTKTGRIRGTATLRAAYNAYKLGKKHGVKEAAKETLKEVPKQTTPIMETPKSAPVSKYSTRSALAILKGNQ